MPHPEYEASFNPEKYPIKPITLPEVLRQAVTGRFVFYYSLPNSINFDQSNLSSHVQAFRDHIKASNQSILADPEFVNWASTYNPTIPPETIIETLEYQNAFFVHLV